MCTAGGRDAAAGRPEGLALCPAPHITHHSNSGSACEHGRQPLALVGCSCHARPPPPRLALPCSRYNLIRHSTSPFAVPGQPSAEPLLEHRPPHGSRHLAGPAATLCTIYRVSGERPRHGWRAARLLAIWPGRSTVRRRWRLQPAHGGDCTHVCGRHAVPDWPAG